MPGRLEVFAPVGRMALSNYLAQSVFYLLVFTGVQLITLGLLAEMQVRTYHESQDKRIYVIREVREQSQD